MNSTSQASRSPSACRQARHLGPLAPRSTAKPAPESPSTTCPECGASYVPGRWAWGVTPTVRETTCPDCQRARDLRPAHVVRVEDATAAAVHELLAAARHVETAEVATHPLERLLVLEHTPTVLEFGATGVHLARRLLAALLRTFRRHLEVLHTDERNTWFRWRTV